MGVVALITLALVAWSFYENHKPEKALGEKNKFINQ